MPDGVYLDTVYLLKEVVEPDLPNLMDAVRPVAGLSAGAPRPSASGIATVKSMPATGLWQLPLPVVLASLSVLASDVAAPLVGIGGGEDVLPLGIVTVIAILLAVVAYLLLVGREGRRQHPVDPTFRASTDSIRIITSE